MTTIPLSWFDLALCATLLLALIAISRYQALGLARSLLIASTRMVVQLLLIGLLLRLLFAHPAWQWTSLAALIMLAMASREVVARQPAHFAASSYWIAAAAMFVSSFSLALFAVFAVLHTQPWYDPRYAIPLLGMLLGNTLTAVSLGMERLITNARQQASIIEQRLMLGATASEASNDLTREAMRAALMPMINGLATAGVVSLPGMMTGQILAGNSPLTAVKYQIMVMFLIAAGTGAGALLAVVSSRRLLFDERERLRLDRLNMHGS